MTADRPVSARRIAYLGPAGTFTEDALREALGEEAVFEAIQTPTILDAFEAVADGRADLALAPFENSIEGSVRSSLDALALDVKGVTIVGEHDYRVQPYLIARSAVDSADLVEVLSHPQPLAQCARFLRERAPNATLRPTSSTAQAVKEVSETIRPVAALGAFSAAELYECTILEKAVPDAADNITRFVWVAPTGTVPDPGRDWKTSVVFSELGADHPGALVEALLEFSDRDVNLSRIESRPLRQGLGRYMFFIDIEGAIDDPAVSEALAGLRSKAERVTILGSYPTRN